MTDSLLKSRNNDIIAKYAGVFFDLSLLMFILTPSLAQRRINLEYSMYRLVTYLIENIEFFVANGAWMKVTNSPLFEKVFTHYSKMYTENRNTERVDVFGLHVLNLYEHMRRIDLLAQQNYNIADDAIKQK